MFYVGAERNSNMEKRPTIYSCDVFLQTFFTLVANGCIGGSYYTVEGGVGDKGHSSGAISTVRHYCLFCRYNS